MPKRSDEGKDFDAIQTNIIPEVTHVRLYLDTSRHIRERHPEVALSAGMTTIVDTIENPTEVYSSSTDPHGSYIYVSKNNTLEDHPLTVPVKVVEGTSARVKTAYYNSGTQPKDRLLWSGGRDES